MKARWWIIAAAGLVVVAIWVGIAAARIFFEPSTALWVGMVTAGALALEGFFWVCAGVLGWSFLAGRRATLQRLRQRFFGGRDKPAREAE